MTLGPISSRSVERTLASRGVRPPPAAAIQRHLQTLTQGEVAELKQLLRRVEQGVERPGEIDALLQSLRSAVPPADDQKHSQASPATEHPNVAPTAPTSDSPERPDTRRDERVLLRQHGMHVWAASGALKIELAQLPGPSEDRDGIPVAERYTVQFEGARKIGASYAWDRKVIFQLTGDEIPLVAAFILGFAGNDLELSKHGQQHDKLLGLRAQAGGIFLRVAETGQKAAVGVPLSAVQVFRFGEILCIALTLNRPRCPAEMQLALLRRVGQLHLTLKPKSE